MTKPDWFRRTTWTAADAEDFDAHLARARHASRSQYLRIQAIHLREVSENRAALGLLERMLRDYPDKVQLASAHLEKAMCHATLNEIEPAILSFRAALETERAFPNVLTNAYYEFPLFVAQRCLREHFAEALNVLGAPRNGLTFAVGRFKAAAARAIIANSMGDAASARSHAVQALAAAAEGHSGLSRHPTVGLVRESDGLVAALCDLAKVAS